MNNKYLNVSNILIMRNHVTADKDYLYSIEDKDNNIKYFITPKDLKKLHLNLYKIHVIAVESYMSLELIFKWFVSCNVPIYYDVHDYHCIWYETHFVHKNKLLSEDDLKNSSLNYITTHISFNKWHQIWDNFLNSTELITVFSESSKNIILHYFPQFEKKIQITPHSLDYIKCKNILKIASDFNIGIFGIIKGVDKGSKVLNSFLEFIKDKNINVYINGDLNKYDKVYSDNIHYMGKYDVNRLDEIITKQQISTVLFPSICPETFSYTISELIHVGIPVACFNTGAQAEKIDKYELGQIIDSYDNESILKGLQKAYEKGQKKYN